MSRDGAPPSENVEVDERDGFEALLREAFELPAGPGPMGREALLKCLRCGYEGRQATARCPADGGPMVPAGHDRIGETVGAYRILECLGSGGVGTVYRARHRTLGREAAIKYLRAELADDSEQRSRLEREAQVIAQLDHDNVVRVLDYVADGDRAPVLIMELIRGRTLSAALEADGPFEPARALAVVRQVARALARAHRLGILHRDIKPSNVLLCRVGGDPDFVKVLDFGIARAQGGLRLTRSHAIIGTPLYMSPEQARRADLGPASDLYSLGCVLFELLTGEVPFLGSAAIVMHAHVHRTPPPLSSRVPNASRGLCAIVDRLLHKDPERRYPDAHALLHAMDAITDNPSPSRARDTQAHDTQAHDARALGMVPERELARRLAERLAHLERLALQGRGIDTERLTEAKRAIATLSHAGAALTAALRAADADDRSANERRAQVGHALDALAADLSQASLDAAAREDERAQLTRAQVDAIAAVCASQQRCDARDLAEPRARCDARDPAEPRVLDPAQRQALGDLVTAAAELDAVERQRQALEAAWIEASQRRDDLHFQVEQLRGRMATLTVDARARRDTSEALVAVHHAHCHRALEDAATALDSAAESCNA